jgi:hypothetical protein
MDIIELIQGLLIFLIVVIIFIVGLTIFYNIFVFIFVKKQLVKEVKSVIARHKENKYTRFELDTLKNITTDTMFKYYFLFCQNKNIWKDLQSHLKNNEIISEMSWTQFIVKTPKITEVFQGVSFSTTLDNFFIYKDILINRKNAKAKLVVQCHVSDIETVEYKIKPGLMKTLKHCVPGTIVIRLKNKTVITVTMACCRSAEILQEKLWQLQAEAGVEINQNEASLSIEERQIQKLNRLKEAGKIKEEAYLSLKEVAFNTPEMIMQHYIEEFEKKDTL